MAILFPYDNIRPIQSAMIEDIEFCLKHKIHLIAHAPTGLGKTSAALAPALDYAKANKKKIFFLTSRHTQHTAAIKTLEDIKHKHEAEIPAVDIIGKQHMCSLPAIHNLSSGEFSEFCKKQKEEGKCPHYLNTRKTKTLTTEAQFVLEDMKNKSPLHVEGFKKLCVTSELCTYEMAMAMAESGEVIVADYYYIFNPAIRSSFMKKIDFDLEDSIVIIDEAHNLPERMRSFLTNKLTSRTLKIGMKEAQESDQNLIYFLLSDINDILNEMGEGIKAGDEQNISKDWFMDKLIDIKPYEEIIDILNNGVKKVLEKKERSILSSIADFFEYWKGTDEGFVRFVQKKIIKNKKYVILNYRCLDPSIMTKGIIGRCHSVILMSGTLQPTGMYKELLGFPDRTMEREYESPFPEKNRLNLIIPKTSTKFTSRNDEQYKAIAKICASITNLVPGNCALFFPSYYLRDKVYSFFNFESKKTSFVELPEMSKEDKEEFLSNFKSYKKTGAVLLGAISGSYGEGIDLPGDLLNCVIVVGLPLQKPNLETKALIEYYEKRFGRGWDYGYVFPAFQKTLQSAGRCIRSESDRGVVVFLDERYIWSNYFKNFPKDWKMNVTERFEEDIINFFLTDD